MANVINSLKLGSGTYVFTTPYATCGTAADVAAKVATITPGSNFSLETGARVAVKFTNANTAASPTLNVNSTGAKAIYFKNAALAVSNYWSAGQIIDFIYDGTNWVCSAVVTDNNTDTKNTAGATDTSSKIFLIGATSQAANPQTYSKSNLYSDSDGNLNNIYVNSSEKLQNTIRLDPNSNYITIGTSGIGVADPPMYAKYGRSDIKHTTNGTNIYTLSLPSKTGTLALTSDIPPTSSFVTLSDTQTISGVKTFSSTIYASSGGIVAKQDSDNFTTYERGSIVNNVSGNSYILNLPTKGGTLATTSDLNGYVDIASAQTISGKKTFTGGVQFGTNTVFNNGGIQIPAANAFKVMGTYDVSLPSKTGTIALTSDIPSITTSSTFDDSIDIWDTTYSGDKFVSIEAAGSGSICVHNDDDGTLLTLNLPAINNGTYTIATTDDVNGILTGNNTFTGITAFNNTVSCGTIISSSGFMAANGSNSSNSASLKYNCITRSTNNTTYTLTLPTKSGTLATTSDIPIKTATLSGTTLSITLS